jgi:ribonucleotide monophosphatase NagD (HAD superfamily)
MTVYSGLIISKKTEMRTMPILSGMHGLLIDLDGVLYVGETPVAGARELLIRLDNEKVPRRFLINTTTKTASAVVQKLKRLGFDVDERCF